MGPERDTQVLGLVEDEPSALVEDEPRVHGLSSQFM